MHKSGEHMPPMSPPGYPQAAGAPCFLAQAGAGSQLELQAGNTPSSGGVEMNRSPKKKKKVGWIAMQKLPQVYTFQI
ncbi:hypothetical protein Y1Q_0004223 [Alligator mississippiensis]|uniref:Uncharacterized protein n=1 Tax=Alligator mississippiensis TaxID=8496 RepID=A0A151M7N4_ALLMI|nr:hypothetical protein Y1Q_0004223 [Alligator mississippiensis]